MSDGKHRLEEDGDGYCYGMVWDTRCGTYIGFPDVRFEPRSFGDEPGENGYCVVLRGIHLEGASVERYADSDEWNWGMRPGGVSGSGTREECMVECAECLLGDAEIYAGRC